MFHYGWARPARAIREKFEFTKRMYPGAAEEAGPRGSGAARWHGYRCLRPFTGDHPAVAKAWIAACAQEPPIEIEPARFRLADLRYYVSHWIERLTGAPAVRVSQLRTRVDHSRVGSVVARIDRMCQPVRETRLDDGEYREIAVQCSRPGSRDRRPACRCRRSRS